MADTKTTTSKTISPTLIRVSDSPTKSAPSITKDSGSVSTSTKSGSTYTGSGAFPFSIIRGGKGVTSGRGSGGVVRHRYIPPVAKFIPQLEIPQVPVSPTASNAFDYKKWGLIAVAAIILYKVVF